MFWDFKSFITTATFRQSVVTFTSTAVSGLLAAVFYFVLAKWLGVTGYGAFSAVVALVTMMSSVFDLGTSQGLVKFSRSFAADEKKSQQVVKLSLLIKLASGAMAILIFLIFGDFIATRFLHQPGLTPLLQFAGLGIFASLLFSFISALAQTRSQYGLWGAVLVGPNFLRLFLITLLFLFFRLDPFTVVLIYCLVPLAAFLGGLLHTSRKFLSVHPKTDFLSQFFSFNKWFTATAIISTFGSRLDTLLTTRVLDLASTGVYALAVQMITIIPQLSTALGAVTTPKFSAFPDAISNANYLKKALFLSVGVGILIAAVLIPAAWILIRLVGVEYRGAFLPFLVLLIAMCIFFASSPLRDSITYYFSRPQFFFWLSISNLVLTVILNLWLLPVWGIVGAAAAALFIQIFSLLLCIFYYLSLKKLSRG